MKFAVSMALVALLLGMPLGCILVKCQVPAPCCPRTSTSFKCPYDALDTAKVASLAAAVDVPIAVATGIAPPPPPVLRDLRPEIAEDQPDLCILNRILRI
jgi:hypothetical protein